MKNLYFRWTGVIADIDETTADNPLHPASVLVMEIGAGFERIVLPAAIWSGSRELLRVGRRIRVSGHLDTCSNSGSLPVAERVELIGVLH